MNTVANNSNLTLLMAISLIGLLVLIGIALFVSPNNVLAITGLGSAIIAGIVAITNKNSMGDVFRRFFPKHPKEGDYPLDN